MIHRKKSVSDRNTQADGSIEKESERNKKGREREKEERGEGERSDGSLRASIWRIAKGAYFNIA